MPSPARDRPTASVLVRDPATLGLILSGVAAVGYTATNVFLRQAAGAACNPSWVQCVKAVPTAVAAVLILACRWRSGQSVWPGGRQVAVLVLLGVMSQVGANLPFQWALGAVGMAIAVPVCTGVMIASSAVLGAVWLYEAVTLRTAAALVLLIAAVAVLSGSRNIPPDAALPGGSARLAAPAAAWQAMLLGSAAAAVAGLVYAALNVSLRKLLRGQAPLATTLLVISLAGVFSLGGTALAQIGTAGIRGTTAAQWQMFLAAGVCNAVAFFALSKALALITVVQVNMVNALSVALSALAGVGLFGEAINVPLAVGLVLTIAGIVTLRPRRRHRGPAEAA